MKIRLQLQGELSSDAPKKYNGMFRGLITIFREEGIRGWCGGLAPSMLREASYSTLRMGLYDPIKGMFAFI